MGGGGAMIIVMVVELCNPVSTSMQAAFCTHQNFHFYMGEIQKSEEYAISFCLTLRGILLSHGKLTDVCN